MIRFLRAPFVFLKKKIKELEEYNRIAKIDEIARRYFAMNAFDGVLTMLGILLGSYYSHLESRTLIIAAGLGASIAMGVSGMWGSYLTESAERKKKLRDLEGVTLSKLGKTRIGRAARLAPFVVSIVDGLSPFLASLIVLSPFVFITTLPIHSLYTLSIGIAFAILFLLGLYLGRISRENILMYGAKMVLAGILCVVLNLLLISK